MVKAELITENGMDGEYFVIQVNGVKCAKKFAKYYTNGKMSISLRMSMHHYEWIEDPERLLSEIVKAINEKEEG